MSLVDIFKALHLVSLQALWTIPDVYQRIDHLVYLSGSMLILNGHEKEAKSLPFFCSFGWAGGAAWEQHKKINGQFQNSKCVWLCFLKATLPVDQSYFRLVLLVMSFLELLTI